MLTVLMIDDDNEISETVREEANSRFNDLEFVIESDFDKAEKAIGKHRPDMLILDMYRGQPIENDIAGHEIWKSLWVKRFCPVVVYTAGFEGLEPDVPENHPFVSYLEKGDGSDISVVEQLEAFQPTALAFRAAEIEVERVFQSVLQEVAKFVFSNVSEEGKRTEMIIRAGRRRVAAMMDEAFSDSGRGLLGWEQYLFPPIGEGLLMGDVIQAVGSSNDDSASYFLVLSPSCDIQPGRCKVKNILVARCGESSDYVTCGVNITNANKAKDRLPKTLNDAHASGYALLPALPGRFPAMSVNLRDLSLITPEEIGQADDDDKKFVRVVSIDSPFREQLAWAYLQVSARPGLPNREHAETVDELVQSLKAKGWQEMIAIDFFCGAGGLTRGMLDAGVKVKLGIDVDDRCKLTYETNNNPAIFKALDIADCDFNAISKYVDTVTKDNLLFAGCAPCQPFSQQRKSCEQSPLGTLLGSFGEYIQHFLPGQVFIENVPGITKVSGFSTYKRFLRLLDQNNYTIASATVDAKKFGVPQTRRRFILIAMRGVVASLPEETHGTSKLPYETVKNAIKRFPRIVAGKQDPAIPNHVAASISDLNMKRLRHTPQNGGDRRAWPKKLVLDCHKGDYNGHSDVYGRMWWNQPAPALTGRCHSISNGRYGHPSQNRAISLREAASLQSFDDSYEFFGSNRHIALQIGNAVPVKLAEVMAKHVIKLRRKATRRKSKKRVVRCG